MFGKYNHSAKAMFDVFCITEIIIMIHALENTELLDHYHSCSPTSTKMLAQAKQQPFAYYKTIYVPHQPIWLILTLV